MSREAAQAYLSRPAEMLILQGYRHWGKGHATQEAHEWKKVWDRLCQMIGDKRGRVCLQALSQFVETLDLCAACPLKTLAPATDALCRDECLIIGLISALQHNDPHAIELCLTELTCPSRCDDVAFAAKELAITLQVNGFMLCPVPIQVLSEIAYNGMESKALH